MACGCFGHNNEQDELVPKEHREFEGQFAGARALSLAPGGAHTTVVTTCGVAWIAALDTQLRVGGQLRVGNSSDRHAPVRVAEKEAFGQSKVHNAHGGVRH